MTTYPSTKEHLLDKSVIHLVDESMDDTTRMKFWKEKVHKTHIKILGLVFQSKIRNVSDDAEFMGIPINSTLVYLQSQIHPKNVSVYPKATHVVMLSDDGVTWCNIVHGVITGKFDDQLFRDVKK